MFSPISAATEQLSMDMYTRKNDHAQSVVDPHLAVVLTSVVHTPGFTETEMSFIPCPFKSVTKFSTEYMIRHMGLDAREDLYILQLSALKHLEYNPDLWCLNL